jgi:hypothetical protein
MRFGWGLRLSVAGDRSSARFPGAILRSPFGSAGFSPPTVPGLGESRSHRRTKSSRTAVIMASDIKTTQVTNRVVYFETTSDQITASANNIDIGTSSSTRNQPLARRISTDDRPPSLRHGNRPMITSDRVVAHSFLLFSHIAPAWAATSTGSSAPNLMDRSLVA